VLAEARRTFAEGLGEAFSSHLTEAEVVSLRRLMRKLLEGNGAWVDARCDPGFAR
jgi:hypothetical protein